MDRASLGFKVMERVPVRTFVPRRYRGIGSILMLHRVQHGGAGGLPGGINEANCVEPTFLRGLIELLRRRGHEFVTIEEGVRRLVAGDPRRFTCLTVDDGYRDTYEVVHPLCRELGVPYTVYVMTGQLDGWPVSWWIGLEEVLRRHSAVELEWRGSRHRYNAENVAEKLEANKRISQHLRDGGPDEIAAAVGFLSERYSVDFATMSQAAAMTPDMLHDLARHDYVEIGSHTVHHISVRQAHGELAFKELADSRRTLEQAVGRPVRHFAYPYGTTRHVGPDDPTLVQRAGYESAVTTNHANVGVRRRWDVRALPRLPVDGTRQSLRYMDAVLSGAVAALTQRHNTLVTR